MKKTLIFILVLNSFLLLTAILHEWSHYSSSNRASYIRKAEPSTIELGRTQTRKETNHLRRDHTQVTARTPDKTKAGINSPPLVDSIILFCYDREEYLEKTLLSLASLKGLEQLTVYVSQDGSHPGVAALVERLGQAHFMLPKARGFVHWQHPRNPLLGPNQPGHAWLSQHYKWGLDKIFLEEGRTHAIIIEDDMIFSPDFLAFFQATAGLMQQDPSIWCASSWNDNGQASLEWNKTRLYRSSYFPGLGWMMRKELWLEIGTQFPNQAWDHWMRLNTTSKGRDCVVPEVNRNKNIGEFGANMNANVFKTFLEGMAWAEQGADAFGDLHSLMEPEFENHMRTLVLKAELWTGGLLDAKFEPGKVYLVPYLMEEYEALVKPLKLWPFPRGHYRHLTRIPVPGGAQVLLADRRACPLLPKHLRVLPDPQLQPTVAERAVDCSITCRSVEKQCSESNFWFINSCEILKQHFPCESGCAVELGGDIPNYVMDPALGTFHSCLIAQQQPRCDASHPATARLCPCT